MLPIAVVNNYNPVPVSLAGATLPGSVVAHVPYDNVAPSISSAEVNNNASPNSEMATSDQAAAIQADANDGEQTSSAAANNAAQNQSGGAQATFIAQLISQDISPPAQTILVQYEKLVAISNVKYKPSNASKPAAAPSSAFGQILQQSKPAVNVQPVQPVQPQPRQPVAATPAAVSEEAVAANPEPVVLPQPRPPVQQRPVTVSVNTSKASANAAPQITSAYMATASRVTAQSLETTTELA